MMYYMDLWGLLQESADYDFVKIIIVPVCPHESKPQRKAAEQAFFVSVPIVYPYSVKGGLQYSM